MKYIVKTARERIIGSFFSKEKALEFAMKKLKQRTKNSWFYRYLYVCDENGESLYVITRDEIIDLTKNVNEQH